VSNRTTQFAGPACRTGQEEKMRNAHVVRLALLGALLGLMLTAAQAATPTAADKAFSAGKQFYTLRLYPQALDELQKFVVTYPADPRVYEANYIVGRIYAQQQKYDLALAAFTPIVTKATSADYLKLRAETHFQIAECYFQQQKFDKAALSYDNCTKISGYDADLTARARYWKAESLYQLGKYDEAEVEYQKVADSAPKHALASWAFYSVGMIELRQKAYAKAVAPLERVTTEYKDSEVAGEATLALGFAYAGRARETTDPAKTAARDADFRKAIALFSEVIDSERATDNAKAQAQQAQAEAYFGLKDYVNAEAAYGRVLARLTADPRQATSETALETRMWRGHALYNAERYADAAAEYGRVVAETAPDDKNVKNADLAVQALYWQGNSWHQAAAKQKDAKAHRDAVAAFKRFLTLGGPKHTQAPRAALLLAFNLEDLATDNGEAAARPEAVTAFKAVLDAWPLSREAKEAQSGIARLTSSMSAPELAGLVDKLPPGAAAWNANLRLAREDFINGKYDKAIIGVRAVIEGKPDADVLAQAYYLLGAAQQKQGRPDDAIAAYKQVLANVQTGELVQFAQRGLAQAYLDVTPRRYADALAAAQALLKLNLGPKENAEALMYLAEAALGNGQHADALEAYQKVAKTHPDSPLAASALMGAAWVAETKRDLPTAIACYKELITKYPTAKQVPEASFRMGVKLQEGKDYTGAIEAFKNVPATHTLADQAAYAIAWALRDSKKDDEANAQFALVAEKFPKSTLAVDSLFRIGEFWLEQKNYGEALKSFVLAQDKIGGGDQPPLIAQLAPLIAYKLGVCAFFSEKYAQAASAFGKVVTTYPTNENVAESLFWRGQSLERQGEAQAAFARDAYVQYLAKFPKGELILDAALGAGRCALAAKQYATARDDLKKAVDLCDANAGSANAKLADRAKNVAPETQYYMGETFYMEKKYGDALKEFARVAAYQYEPWYSRSMLRMARCSAYNGDKGAAERMLKMLLRNFPKSDAAQDIPATAREFNLSLAGD
jgi:TolA-binding protein